MKGIRHITGGIFYCRDSAGFSISASNKFSCNLTGQCFEIGNKNIPPKRYMHWQTTIRSNNPFDNTYLKLKYSKGYKTALILGIFILFFYFSQCYSYFPV